jgi:tRNA(adenine34) deaminase
MYLMNQIDHYYWMNIALNEAKIAALQDEVPVGAVLVKDNKEIARGHNMPIQSNDPSAHAEIVVIRKAGIELSNYRLPNLSLYVTLEPCLMCAGAIMNSRIAQVFYGANDPKTGVATSVLNVFDNRQLNHHCQIEGGILDHECGHVLKDFFKNKRESQV